MGLDRAIAVLSLALGAAALAPAARAYDLDPGFGSHAGATFRGDEVEDPDFDLPDDFFLAVFSYRHPVEWERAWRDAATGYRITIGSTRTDEFYLEQEARLEARPFDWLALRYRFVHDQDNDSRYFRNLVEGDFHLYRGLFVGLSGELSPRKEEIDVGIGAGLRDEATGFHVRADVILVDFVAGDKGTRRRYERDARTYIVRAETPIGGRVRAGLYAEIAPPFEVALGDDEDETDVRFLMEKYRYGGFVHAFPGRPGEEAEVSVLFQGEHTRKVRRQGPDGLDDPDLRDEDVDRDFFDAEVGAALPVVARRPSDRLLLGANVVYLREDRDYIRPEDDPDDRQIDRLEVYGKLGWRLRLPWRPLARDLFLEPALFSGYAHDADRRPGLPGRTDRDCGLRAKGNLALWLQLAAGSAAYFNLTYRFDEPEFGGGNVQVILTF